MTWCARPVAEKVETADVGSPETIHPGQVGRRGHKSLGPHVHEIDTPRVGSSIAKLGPHIAKLGQHIVNHGPHTVKIGLQIA